MEYNNVHKSHIIDAFEKLKSGKIKLSTYNRITRKYHKQYYSEIEHGKKRMKFITLCSRKIENTSL